MSGLASAKVKVWSELLATGAPEKALQELKSSLESCTEPLQMPLAAWPVMLAGSAARLKVTAMGVVRETAVAASAGTVLATEIGTLAAGVAVTSAESAPSPLRPRAATANRYLVPSTRPLAETNKAVPASTAIDVEIATAPLASAL